MLLSIDIRNFAIIKSLQLDWLSGMSVITGETGAGKSIVIDALGLTLGERADPGVITAGAKQAEITAVFEVLPNSDGFNWLVENDLNETDDDEEQQQADQSSECILRRVIANKGRSKCYINGRSVTQSQLKQLGGMLVDIHGQHAQQSLLKAREQLNLLDRYADHADLVDNVKLAYQQLREVKARKQILTEEKLARDAKRELLIYQVDELEAANPEQSLLDSLEKEHQQAATSQDRLAFVNQACLKLSEDELSCLTQLGGCIAQVNQLMALDSSLNQLAETFTDAESLLQDGLAELLDYREKLACDPETLERLDQKLSQFHDLARKHHVNLPELPAHFEGLKAELSKLHADDDELDKIEQDYQSAVKTYLQQAKLLTVSRQQTAKQLSSLVTEQIQSLAMEGGEFSIALAAKAEHYSATGMEDVEFMVSANPGQPLQSLAKVASGGELSRISLAISVITSQQQLVPCIIFDEVDVGIGGATAETVGNLLQQLATNKQVLCVTHQPQVAACGNQHLVASKTKLADSTSTKVSQLDKNQRVEEIARMLSGKVISDKTRSHASEMLNS